MSRVARRAMIGWFRRRGSWTDEVGYKSPQEIALENAAESLGATLGEYYAEDLNLEGLDLESVRGADPRLDASREELLAYVEGVRDKRRRRLTERRLRAASFVGALLAGAIGMAVVLEKDSGDRVTREKRPAFPLPSGQSPVGTSVSAELPARDGKTVSSTYLNNHGDVCSGLSELRDGVSERNDAGGCLSSFRMATLLRRQPAFVASIKGLAGRTVIQGYARTDVARIAGHSRWGGVQTAMTPTWRPAGSDRVRFPPIKAFLVIAESGTRGRRIDHDPLLTVLDDRNYNLTAQLRDGDVVPLRSLAFPGTPRRDRLFDPIVAASATRRDVSQDQNRRSE